MNSSIAAFQFRSGHRQHLIVERNIFVSLECERLFAKFDGGEIKNVAIARRRSMGSIGT